MSTMPLAGWVAIGTWLVFYLAVVAILLVYHRRAERRLTHEPGEHRFAETSPTKYLLVGLLVGGLVLPFYFYTVKRSPRGALVGFAWLVAAMTIAFGFRALVLVAGPQRPSVTITEPADGAVLTGLFPILHAAVDDLQDGTVLAQNIVWKSGETEIGRGSILIGTTLPAGKHVLTVVATDSDGNSASARVTVTRPASKSDLLSP